LAIRKAVVVRPGGLGDLLLTVPVFQTLRNEGMAVACVVSKRFIPLLQDLSLVDEAFAFDDSKMMKLFISGGEHPVFYGCDLILSYCDEPVFCENLRRFSPYNLIIHSFDYHTLTRPVSDELLEPLRRMGFFPVKKILSRPIPRFPRLFIHPGSGSMIKNWPSSRFFTIYSALKGRIDTKIILGEAEEKERLFWIDSAGNDAVYRDRSLVSLAEEFFSGTFFIGNDSGPSHLAALCGLKTFLFFGPTSPLIWAPFAGSCTFFYAEEDCSPCGMHHALLCKERRCLQNISPYEVLSALMAHL
jgi:ADP-heptose:LPS heptosyltransferase